MSRIWTYEIDKSIAGGGTYVPVTPLHDTSSLSKSLQDNEVFARFDKIGTMRFFGKDVDLLEALGKQVGATQIKIYLDGVLQVTGRMVLTPNKDLNRKIYEYSDIEIVDEYRTIVDGYEYEFNLIDSGISRFAVSISDQYDYFTLTLYSNFGDGIGSFLTTISVRDESVFTDVDIYARQNRTEPDAVASQLIGTNGWQFVQDNGDGTTDIARDWVYSGLAAPQGNQIGVYGFGYPDEPAPAINTILVSGGNAVTHITDGREEPIDIPPDRPEPGLRIFYGIFNDRYYPLSSGTYTRCRDLYDTIKYIVFQLDSSILFDESGTSDDTFFYFKNHTNPDGQNPFEKVLISALPDFILNEDGTEKSDPQAIAYLSFKKITDYFKQVFNVYWFLEERGSDYYMKFVWEPDTNMTIGNNPDLTNLKGINYTVDKKQTEYNSEGNFLLRKRETIATNPDFVGRDISTVGLNTSEVQSFSLSTFFTDVNAILQNPSDFPDNTVNQFVLICTDNAQSDDILASDTPPVFINSIPSFESFTYNPTTRELSATNTTGIGQSETDVDVDGGLPYPSTFEVNYDLQVISGETPGISFLGRNTQLTPGTGQTLSSPDSVTGPVKIIVNSFAQSEFKLTFNYIKQDGLRVLNSTGALTGTANVPNAALSLANLDDEHIALMPSEIVIVNGSGRIIADNRRLRQNDLATIKFPLSDFANWDFSRSVKTDIANAEIKSISVGQNNELAEIQTRIL